jgi:hypothetical protein
MIYGVEDLVWLGGSGETANSAWLRLGRYSHTFEKDVHIGTGNGSFAA